MKISYILSLLLITTSALHGVDVTIYNDSNLEIKIGVFDITGNVVVKPFTLKDNASALIKEMEAGYYRFAIQGTKFYETVAGISSAVSPTTLINDENNSFYIDEALKLQKNE
ncbi:MAG TPA: hypothetical protein VFF04_02245 [Candidatus Babeliales bacterium]|nr:hypothetical protein [Candidatus Babeliales bacterium]